MKQILVELDDELAQRLEVIAPGRKRQRSEFVRLAIVRAIMAEEEQRTAQAYRKYPDDPADVHFDASEWEARDRSGHLRGRRGK